VRGDEGAAIVFNECLLRLIHLRKHQLAAEGGDESSFVAWKMATFQQDALHRVVMLAQGGSNGWNDSNILSSVLCSRALLETVANMHYVVTELTSHGPQMELKAVSDLLDQQLFATRNKDWLKDEAGYRADVAKMINSLHLAADGIKTHYAFVSDFCHPNYLGQHFLFATVDTTLRTTQYSESKNRNKEMLDAILGCLMLITHFENLLLELSKLIIAVPSISRIALEVKARAGGGTLDHPREAGGRERGAALADKDEGRG
jgi:hypothetical protein